MTPENAVFPGYSISNCRSGTVGPIYLEIAKTGPGCQDRGLHSPVWSWPIYKKTEDRSDSGTGPILGMDWTVQEMRTNKEAFLFNYWFWVNAACIFKRTKELTWNPVESSFFIHFERFSGILRTKLAFVELKCQVCQERSDGWTGAA